MKKIIILFSIILSFLSCKENKIIHGATMGTTYMIKTAGNSIDQSQKEEIDGIFLRVNRQMSTYIPESEISLFNARRDSTPFHISAEFGQVLQLSRQINLQSTGAFDVTVAPLVDLWGFGKRGQRQHAPANSEVAKMLDRIGMDKLRIINDTTIAKTHPLLELDLSAVAKGYGVDAVAVFLDSRGYKNFLVEIGGEVYARGDNDGNPWKIGVDRPNFGAAPGAQLEAILAIHDQGLATSGDYRNYFVDKDSIFSHTIDPVTGRPIINGVASVTVTAPSCALADAMATAIMVMGSERSLVWVESNPDVECYIIIRAKSGFVEQKSSGFSRMVVE